MTGQSDIMESALRDVRNRFLMELDQRIVDFEHLKAQITNGPNRSEALRAAARMAHKIRGVAATLGFEKLGALAGSVDDLFSSAAAHANVSEFWPSAAPLFEEFLDEMERVQPDFAER